MSGSKINKDSLRSMINELLNSNSFDDDVVNINPTVDPSASLTDPMNPRFVPQNSVEFNVGLNSIIKNVPIESIPKIYKSLKDVIKSKEDELPIKQDDDDMTNDKEKTQFEESVRVAVRKILSEINPKFSADSDDEDTSEYGDEDDLDNEDSPKRKKKAYKSTALGGMSDVDGMSFEEIAKELGYSVAGAKRAVDMAIEKLRWLATGIDPDDLEILILQSINDYIDMLAGTGELTPADVQLMKDHPQIVRELDGFREYLGTVIRRRRKADQKLMNPIKDD